MEAIKILLLLIMALPFIWWGRIRFEAAVRSQGWIKTILVTLAVAFILFLLIANWPRLPPEEPTP